MQSKPKSNSTITTAIDAATGIITFTVIGAGQFTFDPTEASQGVRARAQVHGFVQRICDRAAKGRDPETGKPAPAVDRMAAMKSLADHYASGSEDWSPKVERTGGGAGWDSLILAAVVEATGRGLEEVKEGVARRAKADGITTKVALEALGRSKVVAPILERIRAEAAEGLDGDEMIEGMFD